MFRIKWYKYFETTFVTKDLMVSMGYNRREIEESLVQKSYNHLMATYLLLGKQSKQVTSTDSDRHDGHLLVCDVFIKLFML